MLKADIHRVILKTLKAILQNRLKPLKIYISNVKPEMVSSFHLSSPGT